MMTGLGLEGIRFRLHYRGETLHVKIPLIGRHSVHTALRAAAVGLAEWLAITHGDQGIKVSVLCPQAVRTAMTAGNPDGVASIDGMMEPEELAEVCVRAIEKEEFLILPHPQVLEYMRNKTNDYGRWIGGMRKLNRRFGERGPS